MKLEATGITVKVKECSILDEASFALEPGELVGLLGPNGAGKSTLLRAVLGMTDMASGEVLLDGKPLRAMAPRERARKIAFLPQERRVEWRLNARDVVTLGRFPYRQGFGGSTPNDREVVERALASVDALHLVDRPFAVLSGGEKTRVLLARALAVEAPILLVDEPVTALDPYHQLHVMEILRQLANDGYAVLAVIHDLAHASRFMDRIVLMNRGEVVCDDSPEVALDPTRLAEVYKIEAERGERGGETWLLPWSRTTGNVTPGRAQP